MLMPVLEHADAQEARAPRLPSEVLVQGHTASTIRAGHEGPVLRDRARGCSGGLLWWWAALGRTGVRAHARDGDGDGCGRISAVSGLAVLLACLCAAAGAACTAVVTGTRGGWRERRALSTLSSVLEFAVCAHPHATRNSRAGREWGNTHMPHAFELRQN